MSSIDTRIVEMRFNNSDFARGAKQTLDQLEQLKKSVKLDGASKGLDELGRSASRFNLNGIGQAVEGIGQKFSVMGTIAVGALLSIGAKAAQVAQQMLGSFSVSPIIDGFHEYETNLNSIQTILANTGLEGQSGLNKVNVALQELNTYSDQTIYNFSEMARNIGTFTAAGVKLDVATGAIKGIANLAALSGSNSEQASTAMYQLSQALATGKVKLMDWNSVVNAGMGGKVFQNALIETAKNQGIAVDSLIKKNGSFRDSLQEGWLTDKVLTETLNKLTGDLTDTQLKAMGYTDKQIVGIQKLAKTASGAATDVKTASQLIGTLQEALGSGWSLTFQTIFGDFGQAKSLFTSINNVLGGAIQQSSAARNKILADWAKAGGRDALFQGIANAFKFLGTVIKPIQEAFRQIFPPTTGAQLAQMSKSFLAFTQGLKIGADTANNLKRTFAGVFAVFHIGFEVVKQVIGLFGRLFGAVGKGSGGFLSTTASVGDFLVALDKALTKGGALADFFDGLAGILSVPIKLFQKLAGFIGGLFGDLGGVDTGGLASGIGGVVASLGKLANAGDLVDGAWTALGNAIKPVWDFFMMIGDKIGSVASLIADGFSAAFGGVDFSAVLKTINTGLFAALVLGVRKFMKNILGAFSGKDSGPSLLSTIKETFGGLTDTLKAMQNTLKAATLVEIAIAVGILAGSVVALSKIDAEGLQRALTGLGVAFGELLAAMAIFEKVAKSGGMIKMPVVAAGLVLLAAAVKVLVGAVKDLSGLDWEGLAKGLTGTLVLVGALVLASKGMDGAGKKMVSTGLGLVLLAAGVKVLVSSVKDFADMDWESIGKGLTGVAAILVALGLYSKFAGANGAGVLAGAGIVLLAVGIKILASAIKDMGSFDWETIGKGLTTLAGALVAIGAALALIPPSSVLSAAAVLIVAASLGLIGDALQQMGSMDWETIAKGLVALGGALGIIAAAMAVMTGTLPGAAAMIIVAASLKIIQPVLQSFGEMDWENIAKAMVVLAGSLLIIAAAMAGMIIALPGAAALVVVAGALAILTPILLALGSMSWESIAKGLVALAGAFTVIGLAGLLLTPLIPSLLGLGVAITLLGVAMLAAGVGVLAFGVGLTMIAAAGAAAAAVLIGVVKGLIQLIPETMAAIGRGIVEFAKVISTSGPTLTSAMVTVMLSIVGAVVKVTPQIISALMTMISKFLSTLAGSVPQMVNSGMKILKGVMDGIRDNIGGIVKEGADIIVKFLQGIQQNTGRVSDEAAKTVVAFVNGVAAAIRNNTGAMQSAGASLAFAIADGMTGGMASRISSVAGQAASMAKSALDSAMSVLGIHSPSKEFYKLGQYSAEGYAKGLKGSKDQILAASKTMTDLLATSQRNAADDVARLQKRLASLNKARHKDRSEIRKTTAELKQARVEQAKTTAAQKAMKGRTITTGQLKLLNRAKSLDALKPKLEAAQKTLADAVKTRDDYQKSVKDQYDTLPQVDKDTQLTDYVTELRQKIVDTRQFAEAVQKLRTMGLNDAAYKDLIAKGPDALPFVQQILAGGKGAVKDLNTLGSQLDQAAKGLADNASKSLYQAAVDSAAGIVRGLQNQQAAIQKQMDLIAAGMVKAIKKALGIKSPSRVFAEVGAYSMEGLAKGLSDSRPAVAAAEASGKDAIFAMQKTLSGLSSLALDSLDGEPTIRPVLDLSSVVRDASQLDTILSGKPISVDAAYISAKGAQVGYDTNADAQKALQVQAASPAPQYQFVQNNTSPKALSDAEIYRQTKNLVSRAKGA
jgi:tape measure domain-containing protein